ncbi:MAG: hypothetical protein KGJ80_10160, partial [Chloroflexota bacterium]|nr:hypothetical protein [Chloroflexota bacterium]
LKWDVEGVRAVYLNGQGVTGHETRIVTPTQTTTYTLHIVFVDATSKDLTATVTVNPAPTPSYSFSVTPPTILAGQSATLKWDVEGVRAVYLNGQGVTGHETRIVTPTQTTLYTLHIVFTDSTTKDLNATVTVTATPLPQWDPRLDALGVTLTRSTAPRAWRVTAATLQDPGQTGEDHHIYYTALRADGSAAAGIKFVIDWVGRDPSDQPAFVTTDANGQTTCPLWAGFDPNLKNGLYFTTTTDQPGDTVSGLGLPSNRHVNFLLTYQYT